MAEFMDFKNSLCVCTMGVETLLKPLKADETWKKCS